MTGSIEDFMAEIRNRIHELADTSITSSKELDDVSLEDVIDYLSDVAPIFIDNLQDAFGVNDLITEADEDEVWNEICSNDVIYDVILREFPSLRDDITSATNVGNIAIDPDLECITAQGELDNKYYQTLADNIDTELRLHDATVGDHKVNVDSITIIVNCINDIYEYTVPFTDLTGDAEKDTDYILDAVLEDIEGA